MTSFGDHHLATLLSAYVDSQLGFADVERVEAHLAVCAECAEAVEEIAQVRGALATPPIVDPSEKLLARLALIEQREVGVDSADGAITTARKWPARVVVAAFGLAASLALLAVLGTYDLPDVSGNVAKRAQSSLLNQSVRGPQFMAAAYGIDEAGTLEPDLRALANRTADLELIAINREVERDEIEAVMRLDEAQVVVRDRRGKLPSGDDALGATVEVSGYEVQVVSQSPWTAVWQRGDRVISVAADAPHDTIALIIESFPPVPVDDGIGARVLRGVHKVGQVIG